MENSDPTLIHDGDHGGGGLLLVLMRAAERTRGWKGEFRNLRVISCDGDSEAWNGV